MVKNLFAGLKWMTVIILVLALIIATWLGLAWVIAWGMGQLFALGNYGFGPDQYVAFGSCILVFTLVVQIITMSLTIWFLVSWGKARVNKVMSNAKQ
jgi:hypothetical protein